DDVERELRVLAEPRTSGRVREPGSVRGAHRLLGLAGRLGLRQERKRERGRQELQPVPPGRSVGQRSVALLPVPGEWRAVQRVLGKSRRQGLHRLVGQQILYLESS